MEKRPQPITEFPDDPITAEHFGLFGLIVNGFARLELLLQIAISGLTQTPLAVIAVLTAGLSYTGKRDALLSLLTNKMLPRMQVQRLTFFVRALHKHSGIRNDICHSMWTQGRRSKTIKPMKLVVRGGKGRFVGDDDNEADFSLEELANIAQEIRKTNEDFYVYMAVAALLPPDRAAMVLLRKFPWPTSEEPTSEAQVDRSPEFFRGG